MRRVVAAAALLVALICVVSPQRVLTHGSITTTVLFDREIVRVLDTHCVMCHVERGPAFALTSYEQTWVRGAAIRREVLRRHMPPWAAVSGYGEFRNDNSLTPREAQFVVAWVEGLGPRNGGTVFLNVPGGAARAEVRAVAHTTHWQHEPDLVLSLDPQRVAADRAATARVVIDPGLTSARRVEAIEYMPGDARVVRAVDFSVQETGQWLGSWTPWYRRIELPRGVAHLLPAGSHLVASIRYQGAREATSDRGTLGLFFADAAATKSPDTVVLEAMPAATATGHTRRLTATARLRRDSSVWALLPDVAAGVTSIEVTARRPDGGTQILLYARNPSNEWPTPYVLKDPVMLRRGTQLSVIAHSDGNPRKLRVIVSRY